MSEKELLEAILKRFPRVADEVRRKPRVARKVVRLALREPQTLIDLIEQFGYTDRLILAAFRCWPELKAFSATNETAAVILSDLRRALTVVPKHWRLLLFQSDKRSPRVRFALERIRNVLGEER
jgi:hypothetical protein